MRKVILTGILFVTAALTARAGQMGWTIEQCRRRFGKESEIDGNTFYFRLNSRSYVYDSLHLWKGRQGWITFDPDETVGKIEWLKSPGAFSEAEIQQHLSEASAVNWHRVDPPRDDQSDWLRWVGEQNGKLIFDAVEDDNGRGTWLLTITTR